MGDDHGELAARVAVLAESCRHIEEDLREIRVQLEGPPREESVRGRLHRLEGESAAATAASSALAQAQAEHRKARLERERIEQAQWSWRWKLLGAATAIVVAVAPYVTLFYGQRP